MKILLLGANGMIGYNIYQAWHDKHEMLLTVRNRPGDYPENIFSSVATAFETDVSDNQKLRSLIREFRPEAVVNATGITKQRATSSNVEETIKVNAVFPHQLSNLCAEYEARLVLLSTDCIFSGKKGRYTEDDVPDPLDLYGRTKLLGEVDRENVITIRKSTIGLELQNKHGLIEWFLGQKGQIKGYRKAIYSGLTTLRLAEIIDKILHEHPDLTGIWNISSDPIDKYDLLTRLSAALGRKNVEIIPDDSFMCDRSLDCSKFKAATGLDMPSWNMMIDELAEQIHNRETRI